MNSARTNFTHDPGPAYACSLVVAAIMAAASAAGLVMGTGLYRVDPQIARGVAASTAGLLVPGFLAHDGFNLVVGLPSLLVSLWLARRGLLIGLLLLPGALYYILYTYTTYLVGAPFNILFLPYVALVALSAYSIIGLVACIDGELVRQRLAGVVPARTVGVILIVLGLLTLAQDASGAVGTYHMAEGRNNARPLERYSFYGDACHVVIEPAGGVDDAYQSAMRPTRWF